MKFKFSVIAVLLFVFVACGQKNKPSPDLLSSLGQKTGNIWDEKTINDKEGIVTYNERTMTKLGIENFRNEYKNTELRGLPVENSYNTQLFTINSRGYEQTVFFAPKLFSYGSSQGAKRLIPQKLPNGHIAFTFPVILIDGLSKKIKSPGMDSEVDVPDFLMVHKQDDLKEQLKSRLGFSPSLAMLPGCPKKITVNVGVKEYDASIRAIKEGDYCEVNQPFFVSVEMNEKDSREMLEKFLENKMVEVRADFETRVPFAVAYFNLTLDKQKIFSQIQAKLSYKKVWAQGELSTELTKIIKSQSMKIIIEGDINPYIQRLVDQSVDIFFEKMPEDPSKSDMNCGGAGICFKASYNSLKFEQNLSVEWQQSSNISTGQYFVASTVLQPTPNRNITLGVDDKNMLSNLGNSIETGLTVIEGDLIDITPTKLVRYRYDLATPETTTKHDQVNINCRKVCTDSGFLATNMDTKNSKILSRINQNSNRELRDPPPRCRENKIVCDHEDHWIQTTKYSSPVEIKEEIVRPVGKLNELFNGLVFEFSWGDLKGNVKKLTCQLNAFEKIVGDGNSLKIRIKSSEKCPLSVNKIEGGYLLHIANRIQDAPIEYYAGQKVIAWDGSVRELPTKQVIKNPRIDLALVLSIAGYDFSSYSSRSYNEF